MDDRQQRAANLPVSVQISISGIGKMFAWSHLLLCCFPVDDMMQFNH
jgi:hypothetical protein